MSRLGSGAVTEPDAGRTRTADTILNEVEGDLVADDQLVECAERRVAPVKKHFTALGIADETVALPGVNADDPAACWAAGRWNWLVRFAGTGGRFGPLAHLSIMTQYGVICGWQREL